MTSISLTMQDKALLAVSIAEAQKFLDKAQPQLAQLVGDEFAQAGVPFSLLFQLGVTPREIFKRLLPSLRVMYTTPQTVGPYYQRTWDQIEESQYATSGFLSLYYDAMRTEQLADLLPTTMIEMNEAQKLAPDLIRWHGHKKLMTQSLIAAIIFTLHQDVFMPLDPIMLPEKMACYATGTFDPELAFGAMSEMLDTLAKLRNQGELMGIHS
jgi:hypothetical protein